MSTCCVSPPGNPSVYSGGAIKEQLFRPDQLANFDYFLGGKNLNCAHFLLVKATWKIKPFIKPSLPMFYDKSNQC